MTTATENKVLRIGHTPDPDDAYMFYGFASGQVKIQGFEIEHILEDIETLNQKAIHNEIEVTAISAAVYPYIHQNYWILPTGASVGRNYGPIVVKKIGNQSPKTKRIGIPGKNTTAFMLLSFYFPGYEPILYRFDQIPEAIQKGEVDFGLLIHEAQLTFKDYGLEKLMDLGVEWMKETGLPIPLGLDVVRKDLGRPLALQIGSALKKSIEVANQQKEKSVEYALKYGRGMKKSLGEDFVGMYVNEDTLDMGQEGEKALKLLFQKALQMKLISDAPIIDVLR